MKKIIMLALAAIVMASSASASIASNKGKKQKKAKTECCAPKACLATKADSLSYAAGVFTTRGLMDYVSNQYGVDSTMIDSFVRGVSEGLAGSSDKQAMAYGAGLQIARMLETRIYPNVKNDMKETPWAIDSLKFNAGFVDAIKGDTTVMKADMANTFFSSTITAAKKQKEEAYKKENADWLAANAKEEGVKTLPSGLQYKVLTQGTGETPAKDDQVTVRYEGKMIDGTVFDSSYTRNPNTSTFRPDQVIKGWTEALTMMPAGSTWMLYIPQELGYGSRAAGKIKPYSTLIFKVEVVKIDKHEEASTAKEETKTSKGAEKKSTKAQKKTSKKK